MPSLAPPVQQNFTSKRLERVAEMQSHHSSILVAKNALRRKDTNLGSKTSLPKDIEELSDEGEQCWGSDEQLVLCSILRSALCCLENSFMNNRW